MSARSPQQHQAKKKLLTYARVAAVLLGFSEVVIKRVARRGCVDGADHSGVAVRLGRELLAEEPDGLGAVRDREVPGGEARGQARGDENCASVEAIAERVAGVGERGLGHGVVSWPEQRISISTPSTRYTDKLSTYDPEKVKVTMSPSEAVMLGGLKMKTVEPVPPTATF